ncbi:hypothetical protein LUZ60_006207 [Juncus effusus]|nr:hypothetical protein LUZ60_006207 [Juncus effusus]
MDLLQLFMISLCSVFFVVLFCYYFYKENRIKGLRLPPGNDGWQLPFVGETISFMRPHNSTCLGEFLDTQISKYGKIFRMNLLGKPTIISVDPDFNKFILQSDERAFQNSCPKSIVEIMGRWSMIALVGDPHREMRNIAVSFMSKAHLKSRFLRDVERVAVNILDSWTGSMNGSAFSAYEEGKKFAFNLMVKHLMSMDEEDDERENMRREYETFMKGMASLPLNIPGTSYRKALKEEHRRIDERKKENGGKGLNWDDYKEMEFTNCVINETLRLGNVVKFLHKRAIKDVHYKGYDIPSGWHVVPILSSSHLDSSLYQEPHKFNPWRWEGVNRGVGLMAFSGGPRLCPGAELAKLEMAIFLHHLVLKFDWKLAENDYPVSCPFLAFPKGLPIIVTPIQS